LLFYEDTYLYAVEYSLIIERDFPDCFE